MVRVPNVRRAERKKRPLKRMVARRRVRRREVVWERSCWMDWRLVWSWEVGKPGGRFGWLLLKLFIALCCFVALLMWLNNNMMEIFQAVENGTVVNSNELWPLPL